MLYGASFTELFWEWTERNLFSFNVFAFDWYLKSFWLLERKACFPRCVTHSQMNSTWITKSRITDIIQIATIWTPWSWDMSIKIRKWYNMAVSTAADPEFIQWYIRTCFFLSLTFPNILKTLTYVGSITVIGCKSGIGESSSHSIRGCGIHFILIAFWKVLYPSHLPWDTS